MAIIWSIVLAVVVIFLMAAASQLLAGDGVFEEIKTPLGTTRKRFVNRLTGTDWYYAIAVGILVGLINFFAPMKTALPFVAPLCLIAGLGLSVCLMIWWKREGSEVIEMIPFILLAILFYFPSMAAAFATAAMIKSSFWTSILTVLPTIMLVATIGFIIANFFFFRSYLLEEKRIREGVA